MPKLQDLLDRLLGRRPAPPATPPKPSPKPAPTPTGSTIDPINRARSTAGRSTLRDDPALEKTASDWATSMARRGVLEHGDFAARIGAVHPNRAAGENIAEGQATAEAAVAAWLADPPHRAILLGDWDSAGLGHAADARGTLYWVADFARVDR